MEQDEIFSLLSNGVLASIQCESEFKQITLNIMRLEGVAEFNCNLIDSDDKSLNLDINMGWEYAKAIHNLYDLTQNHPLEHKNWNRAIFTLYPDNKFDMEYMWDQELQDRVDGYNNEIS